MSHADQLHVLADPADLLALDEALVRLPEVHARSATAIELHDWCAEQEVPLWRCLALLIELANAVHYAHQPLVIHRRVAPWDELGATSEARVRDGRERVRPLRRQRVDRRQH